jgi:hypothetical protein
MTEKVEISTANVEQLNNLIKNKLIQQFEECESENNNTISNV